MYARNTNTHTEVSKWQETWFLAICVEESFKDKELL